jgi:hypothetical protein
MKAKVIFVGMHNKPGKLPLDSTTKSGKIIDSIIEKIEATCIKTNLCDIDYFPKDKKTIYACSLEWVSKQKPSDDTIIVLLGGWVQKNLKFGGYIQEDLSLKKPNFIKIAHPASIFFGKESKDKYINNAVEIIKKHIACL